MIGDFNKSVMDFLLVFDSHAAQAQPLLNKISLQSGIRGISGSYDGCPPLLGVYQNRGYPHPNDWSKRCYGFNQNEYEFVKNNDVKTVFLIARWDYYVNGAKTGSLKNFTDVNLEGSGEIDEIRQFYNNGIRRTFDAYRKLSVKVIVVLQVPHQNVNVKRFLENLLGTSSVDARKSKFSEAVTKAVTLEEHLKHQKIASAVWRELAVTNDENELIIIDHTHKFCDAERCQFVKRGISCLFEL